MPQANQVPPRSEDGGDAGERMIVLAAVAGAHGLKGEVRLKLFTDNLSAYPELRCGDRSLMLESLRGEIARFSGIGDRAAAEALRKRTLAVPRAALPPLGDGEYYHADLLDLPAVSSTGEPLGRVVAVDNYGAGDVLEIERPDGRRFMVPMRVEAVRDWNAERAVIDAAFVS